MNQQKIIEIIGLISVVGSLIFVGVEISQNTAAVRGATQQEISEQVSELYRIIVENEKFSELDVKVLDGVTKNELSKNDYNRYTHYSLMAFRRIENIHLQYKNGFLNENAFNRIGMPFYRLPLLKEIWEDQKHAFEPEFAEFFEKLRDGEN
tara:strand:- start:77 stop:529 length:453 start_codon:yes stop_codon:yes gene_type:complete